MAGHSQSPLGIFARTSTRPYLIEPPRPSRALKSVLIRALCTGLITAPVEAFDAALHAL